MTCLARRPKQQAQQVVTLKRLDWTIFMKQNQDLSELEDPSANPWADNCTCRGRRYTWYLSLSKLKNHMCHMCWGRADNAQKILSARQPVNVNNYQSRKSKGQEKNGPGSRSSEAKKGNCNICFQWFSQWFNVSTNVKFSVVCQFSINSTSFNIDYRWSNGPMVPNNCPKNSTNKSKSSRMCEATLNL